MKSGMEANIDNHEIVEVNSLIQGKYLL